MARFTQITNLDATDQTLASVTLFPAVNSWPGDELLFEQIAQDIETQGFSVQAGAMPAAVTDALYQHSQRMQESKFVEAGIGRGDDDLKNEFVRTDAICWITGESDAGQHWNAWTARLQAYLNRRLFLGLFSFESHFAHYSPGDYYKRHYDAFRGETNRVLSVVAYLNPGWTAKDGGELVLYHSDTDRTGTRIVPLYGTLVVFLSEEFPHEVLPSSRDRYSVAGWYRVNSSINGKVDPPR